MYHQFSKTILLQLIHLLEDLLSTTSNCSMCKSFQGRRFNIRSTILCISFVQRVTDDTTQSFLMRGCDPIMSEAVLVVDAEAAAEG